LESHAAFDETPFPYFVLEEGVITTLNGGVKSPSPYSGSAFNSPVKKLWSHMGVLLFEEENTFEKRILKST